MEPYHKIENVFKRDPETHRLIRDEFRMPEFEALRSLQWDVEEKVDGTNIRVLIDEDGIRYGGRTNRAQLPADLVQALREMFEPKEEAIREQFPDGVCLYGEGYGAGIQKVGKLYRPDKSFVLFDIRVGEWWLSREAVIGLAQQFEIPRMNHYLMTLDDAIELVASGLTSEWGDFPAEGVIARAPAGLRARSGARIITKIKTCDFETMERQTA